MAAKSNPHSLIERVHQTVVNYGTESAPLTSKECAQAMNLTRKNVSPELSKLVFMDRYIHRRKKGQTMLYWFDPHKINPEFNQRAKDKPYTSIGRVGALKTIKKREQVQPQKVAEQNVAEQVQRAPQNRSEMKLTVECGRGHYITLPITEARDLYNDLRQVFNHQE